MVFPEFKQPCSGTRLAGCPAYNIGHEGSPSATEFGRERVAAARFPVNSGSAQQLRTVLVVDDEPAIRALYNEILTDAGYAVIEASEGKAAIRYAQQHTVDLIITDLLMPEFEGIETIRYLRGQFPQVPIVAISGISVYLEPAKLLGASAVLQKPVSADELVTTVRGLLG